MHGLHVGEGGCVAARRGLAKLLFHRKRRKSHFDFAQRVNPCRRTDYGGRGAARTASVCHGRRIGFSRRSHAGERSAVRGVASRLVCLLIGYFLFHSFSIPFIDEFLTVFCDLTDTDFRHLDGIVSPGLPTGEDEPTIQRCRPACATAAWPDADGGGSALDNIPQADFFITS